MPRDPALKTLVVLGFILCILVLIGCIPVGVDAAWDPEGLRMAIRVGPFSIRLGGRKKEKAARPNQKKEKSSAAVPVKREKRALPPLPVLKILAKNGYNTLCRLLARVRTDFLKINFTSAFADPALTALAYGAAGTAMEGLLEAGGCRIRRSDLRADVDFEGGEPLVDARGCMTLRIRQILGAAIRFGFGFLRDYLRYKKEVA